MAVFWFPVVLLLALPPMAVLSSPVVLSLSAPAPLAVLSSPMVLLARAKAPAAVLDEPSVLFIECLVAQCAVGDSGGSVGERLKTDSRYRHRAARRPLAQQ